VDPPAHHPRGFARRPSRRGYDEDTQSGVVWMWWRRCDGGGRSRWLLWTAATAGVGVFGAGGGSRCRCRARVPVVTVPRRRPPCYHGFHVLRDSGVPRVPANGTTVDCEQLREDDQHVLEHHQLHVSARSGSPIPRSPKIIDPPLDHVTSFRRTWKQCEKNVSSDALTVLVRCFNSDDRIR